MPILTPEGAEAPEYTKLCGREGCPIKDILQNKKNKRCGGCKKHFPGEEPETAPAPKPAAPEPMLPNPLERKMHKPKLIKPKPKPKLAPVVRTLCGLGKAIEKLQDIQGITSEELIERSGGMHFRIIEGIKDGSLDADPQVLSRLARALNVTTEYLIEQSKF